MVAKPHISAALADPASSIFVFEADSPAFLSRFGLYPVY